MRPDSIRLKRAYRYFLYFVLALLFLSGAVWAYFNYLLPASLDFAASKSWALKIHGAAAMVILVLIGMLLNGHVKFAWRARRNRVNGVLFLTTFGILTLTGYGLYYAGSERLRMWTSWIHLGLGLVLPVLLIAHIWLGRKTRPVGPRRKRRHFPTRIDLSTRAEF